MAKLQIQAGSTSQTINVMIYNSSTGLPLTGLAYNTSGLTAYYVLPKANSVLITLVTQTVTGAYSSGGFVEIDATHCPGLYRLDVPNAAIASGRFSDIILQGAANMATCSIEIELTATDNQAVDVPQSGDAYLRLGAPVGASISADLQTVQSTILGVGVSTGAALSADANTSNAAGGISGVTSATTLVGTQTSGTYSNTTVLDGVYNVITGTSTSLAYVLQFLTGNGTQPTAFNFTGYVNSGNDTVTLQAWNFNSAGWETIGSIPGQSGSSNITRTVNLYPRHRGTTSAELGKVYIQFVCSGMINPSLHIDQAYVSYTVVYQTVGYSNGAVWLDTVSGVSGTQEFINGTADNPVDTLAHATTLLSSLNLKRLHLISGSSITLASTFPYHVLGDNYTIALGGQDISGAIFEKFGPMSGTATGSNPIFNSGPIGTVTLPPCVILNCGLNGTLTVGSAGSYLLENCFDQNAPGVIPVIDMGAAVGATTMAIRGYSGSVTFNNIKTGDNVTINVVSGGTITVNGTGGTISINGICSVVDGSGGAVTITQTRAINSSNITSSVNAASVTVGTISSSASNIKKNTALSNFPFVMTDSTTHAPKTGLGTTITCQVLIDGGTFGSLTNTASEVGNGVYKINLAAADLNGNNITLMFTASGADARIITLVTQP